jgi:hypothetical protein
MRTCLTPQRNIIREKNKHSSSDDDRLWIETYSILSVIIKHKCTRKNIVYFLESILNWLWAVLGTNKVKFNLHNWPTLPKPFEFKYQVKWCIMNKKMHTWLIVYYNVLYLSLLHVSTSACHPHGFLIRCLLSCIIALMQHWWRF